MTHLDEVFHVNQNKNGFQTKYHIENLSAKNKFPDRFPKLHSFPDFILHEIQEH